MLDAMSTLTECELNDRAGRRTQQTCADGADLRETKCHTMQSDFAP